VTRLSGDVTSPPPPPPGDKKKLRNWWHEILREHGHFKCSAVFLAFSADTAIAEYLKDNAEELNLLSGNSCLVISVSDVGFVNYQKDPNLWRISLQDHITKGYSDRIAKIFGVKTAEFPCLLVFRDIRTSDFVKINLKGLTSDQLVQSMRLVFSTIESAVSKRKDPLVELKRNQKIEALKLIIGEIGKLAEKTFETAIEAATTAAITANK
jgi:hypothetical protein